MLCENCGKNEANVRYTENINGRKRELNLCEKCSKKLGIGRMDFSMPIDFSNFLGGFMQELETPEFAPIFNNLKEIRCNSCNSTFEDIIDTGMLGCQDCYSTFEEELDPIIKKLQGSNRHIGRIGKMEDRKIKNESKKENKEEDKKIILQRELEQAVKEERYEDAAKIRDEIKSIDNKK